MKVKRTYFEFSLACRKQDLCGQNRSQSFFNQQGFKKKQIAVFVEKQRLKYCVYLESAGKARALRESAAALAFRSGVQTLAPKDWFEKWKRDYGIQLLGKCFVLVPVWHQEEYRRKKKDGKLPIFLDPKSAFGAGTHETTRMMILFVESLRGRFEDFLDLGTGTGILSTAAYRLGAKNISGIDCENQAVLTARQNLRRNGCRNFSVTKSYLHSYRREKRFQLVAANLITPVLLKEKAKIQSFVQKNGWLAVSGISKEHFREFRSKFKTKDFREEKVLTMGKWTALLYRCMK